MSDTSIKIGKFIFREYKDPPSATGVNEMWEIITPTTEDPANPCYCALYFFKPSPKRTTWTAESVSDRPWDEKFVPEDQRNSLHHLMRLAFDFLYTRDGLDNDD